MSPGLDDTIVAIASARGAGERGIVRVAGADAQSVVGRVFSPNDGERWASSRLPWRHGGVIDLDGVPLPCAAHLWPTSRSYVGQPLVELHTVGSPPLLDEVVARLAARGARPARRGEFTLRAFLAGRLDLVQAEAVLGVIDADDHVELERALSQLAGGVSSRMHEVRRELLDLLADLEAGLDFVDEDIEFVENDDVVRRLGEAVAYVRSLLDRTAARHHESGRPRVVLAGLPNAGKSTLFNRLVGEEAAIVSDVAGTTRDFLSGEFDCDGRTVELVDTAGWEWQADAISQEAQRQRHERLERADLVVWCSAATLSVEDRRTERGLLDEVRRPVLRVGTMADRGEVPEAAITLDARRSPVAELVAAVGEALSAESGDRGELLASTSARCRESLRGAAESLVRARSAATDGAGDELVALEVREGLSCLGQVLGEVYTDDVLDRVFSKFCIGK